MSEELKRECGCGCVCAEHTDVIDDTNRLYRQLAAAEARGRELGTIAEERAQAVELLRGALADCAKNVDAARAEGVAEGVALSMGDPVDDGFRAQLKEPWLAAASRRIAARVVREHLAQALCDSSSHMNLLPHAEQRPCLYHKDRAVNVIAALARAGEGEKHG